MSQLVTGEAVALDLRPAALPSRLLAALLDALLQGVLLVGLFLGTSYLGTGSDAAAAALSILVIVLATIAYPVAFETALRGRTPGKAALGLRTVRDDGGPIGFRQALVRGLAGAFLERPGITFFFGALVCSLLHPSGKRIGDVLAGTVVLRERVPSRGGSVAVMPPPLAAWAASLDLSALPDNLALQARQFLSRSGELAPAAREDLGGRLVAGVLARTSPPPPADAPGWAVLSAVLAERTRRAQQYGSQQYGTQQYGTQQYGTQQYGTQQYGTQQYGTQQDGAQQDASAAASPPPEPGPPPPPPGPGGFPLPG